MFRTTFYQNAAVVLSAFMRCGVQCLDDFYSAVRGKALRGGYITVLHTHGRNGQYHPHLHCIATSGGYDAQGARWEHLQYLPYDLLRRKWQWHLMSMLRKTLETEAINRLVDTCFRKYPNGLVTNVQKGRVPSQYQSVARYVAKYVVSPPISVRRIDHYDGERVTYHYRSHRTERMEHETVDVATFIGRMVRHTMLKGFKRIRYYGVQATKTFTKVKVAIQAALAKVEGVVKGAVKIIARMTYRQRYEQSTGRDPCICPHCSVRWGYGASGTRPMGSSMTRGRSSNAGRIPQARHGVAPDPAVKGEESARRALCADSEKSPQEPLSPALLSLAVITISPLQQQCMLYAMHVFIRSSIHALESR